MPRIKSSTLPFISLTRLLGGSFLLLRSRNRLDVFKLPRPPESRVQSPEGCEGVASKGVGRSLPKPEARELSLKRDNRNTRRVHHSIKGINTFLEFSGNRSSQGLRKDVDVEGAATKGAGSSSPEPGDAATLSLKRQNENATRELSYGIKGKGKHTSLDGPSDVDVDVEDGSGLVEEMVGLLQ